MKKGQVFLRLRVQPKASRNEVKVLADGRIRVAVTAPPTEGEANSAVCALMARTVGVAKTAVAVVQGEKSRDKTLRLAGIDTIVVERLMSELQAKEQS